MTGTCHVVLEFSLVIASFQNGGRSADRVKRKPINQHSKTERYMMLFNLKHNNEKNQYNEKSDAAYLKSMRAGDGNLRNSLPWPYSLYLIDRSGRLKVVSFADFMSSVVCSLD